MKKVAISIHAIENFKPEIIENLTGFDYIHVDIMDGKFVNSKNDNLSIFRILKEISNTPIIVHLMVINPFDYIKKIIDNIDIFLFHFEIDEDINEIIKEVRNYNKQVGIAINPETRISEIIQYLNHIDLVLIMSVHPGWSGQKFLQDTIKKVNNLTEYKKKYKFIIDVDGGVNLTNAKHLRNADILTSSSTILNSKEPNKIIKLLKESDEID